MAPRHELFARSVLRLDTNPDNVAAPVPPGLNPGEKSEGRFPLGGQVRIPNIGNKGIACGIHGQGRRLTRRYIDSDANGTVSVGSMSIRPPLLPKSTTNTLRSRARRGLPPRKQACRCVRVQQRGDARVQSQSQHF